MSPTDRCNHRVTMECTKPPGHDDGHGFDPLTMPEPIAALATGLIEEGERLHGMHRGTRRALVWQRIGAAVAIGAALFNTGLVIGNLPS